MMKHFFIIWTMLLINGLAWTPDWSWENEQLKKIPSYPKEPIKFLWNNFTNYEERFLQAKNAHSLTAPWQKGANYRVQSTQTYYYTNQTDWYQYDKKSNLLTTIAFSGHEFHFVSILPTEILYSRMNKDSSGWITLTTNLQPGELITSNVSLESAAKLSFVVGTSKGRLLFVDLSMNRTKALQLPQSKSVNTLILDKTSLYPYLDDGSILRIDLSDFSVHEQSPPSGLIGHKSAFDRVLLYNKLNASIIIRDIAEYVEFVFTNSSSNKIRISGPDIFESICAMTLAVNQTYNDLLILATCDGKLWSFDLARFITNTSYSKWDPIRAFHGLQRKFPVKQLAFNYLQTTSAFNQNRMQTGKPVLIIVFNSGAVLLFDFRAQELTSLYPEGVWNVTSNILFAPVDYQNPNPNNAHTANLVVGLDNGSIFRLTNLFFLQLSPTFIDDHRKIFSNGTINRSKNLTESFPFRGFYQKKVNTTWTAIAKAIIQFYLPASKSKNLDMCQIHTDNIEGEDCCLEPSLESQKKIWNSSYDILLPACQTQKQSIYHLITALDSYLIQTISEDKIPSFPRIIAEITNNQPIIVVFEEKAREFRHFIVIIGYQVSLRKLIVWDPDVLSQSKGETYIAYEELLDYSYDMNSTLYPLYFIYTR